VAELGPTVQRSAVCSYSNTQLVYAFKSGAIGTEVMPLIAEAVARTLSRHQYSAASMLTEHDMLCIFEHAVNVLKGCLNNGL
jgi:hypothetical protein